MKPGLDWWYLLVGVVATAITAVGGVAVAHLLSAVWGWSDLPTIVIMWICMMLIFTVCMIIGQLITARITNRSKG